MKKYIGVLMLITLFMLSGCKKEVEVEETVEQFTPVKVVAVTTGDIKEVNNFSGQTKPIKEIDVMGKVPGEVETVLFNVGESVAEGDVLFTFDERDMKNNVASLKSQVASAQVGVDLAKVNVNITGGSQQESQLTQMASSLNSAKITYDNAKTTYDNVKSLYEQGVSAKAEFDLAEQAYLQAENAYKTLETNYNLLKDKQLSESKTLANKQLQQTVASRDSLLVQYNNAKATLEDLRVTSPINGIVATKNVEAGEMYSGGFPAYTIIDVDEVVVTINVTEDMINHVYLNDAVNVMINTIPGEGFKGVVYEISPIPNENTLTYPVKIKIENSKHLIKSGMYAEIELIKNQKQNVVVVERKYLKRKNGQWFAYVVESDYVSVVPVTLGLDNGKQVEIINGLSVGAQIISSGREYVVDGEKVEIVE